MFPTLEVDYRLLTFSLKLGGNKESYLIYTFGVALPMF